MQPQYSQNNQYLNQYQIGQNRNGNFITSPSQISQISNILSAKNSLQQQNDLSIQQISQDDINFLNNLQQKQFMQQQMNQIAHKQNLKKKEILVMTIDIGNGQSGKIHVFDNDDPYDLAVKFVAQYDLPTSIVEILEENIKQNVNQVQQNSSAQQQIYEGSNKSPTSGIVGQQTPFDNNKQDYSQKNNQSQQQNNIINQQQATPNEQQKQNMFTKFPPNNQIQQPSISDIGDIRQNSTKANGSAIRSGQLTTPSKRINKDYPDVISSMKRRIYYPEGLVEKMDNQSFDKYMNINASTDVGNSILNYSVPAGASHSNSQYQNVPQVNQSFHAGYNYYSHNSNNNISRAEDGNSRVNKSFDFGKKQNVHERLYAQSKVKNFQQRETERSKSQANGIVKRVQRSSSQNEINYGVRLYQRGVKQREEKKKQIEKKKQDEIATIDSYCTYHPQINEISSIIAQSLRQEPVGEFLQKVAKQQRERKERARSFKLNSELDGCSFNPQINQISNQIAQEKLNILINQSHEDGKSLNQSQIRNRYDLLYEDSKNKIERKIQRDNKYKVDQKCSFQPKINTFSKILMNDISFFERMQRYSSKENYNRNQEHIQQQQNQFIDPLTGQQLFKPITGRPPQKQRNRDNQSVGEYLYEQSRIKQISKQQNLINDSSVNRSMACEASTKIIDAKKRQKLIEIFNLLDSDQDNQISAQAIDIQQLDPLILETFSPILCEMEELDQSLTLEEFLQASEKLIQGLNVQQRNQIFNIKKKKTSEESFDFKPKLNPKSIQIAQAKRPQGCSALYETFMEDKIKFDEKIKMMRDKKEQEELGECTFTPNIQPLYSNQQQNMSNHSSNKYQTNHQNIQQNRVKNTQPMSFQNFIDKKVNNFIQNEQNNAHLQNDVNNFLHEPINYSMFSYEDYQKLFESKNNNQLFKNNIIPQGQNYIDQNNNQQILNYENYNLQ